MSDQQHIIKRQLFELKFSAKLDAVDVQNRVVAAFNKTVVPLMNAYFNEYSLPENTDEIEQLELNLGRIRLNELEEDLVEKIAFSLNEQLPQFCNQLVYDDPAVLEAQIAFLSNQSTPHLSTDLAHSSLLNQLSVSPLIDGKPFVESENAVLPSHKNELDSPRLIHLNESTEKEVRSELEAFQNTSSSDTFSTKNKRETAVDSFKMNPVVPTDGEHKSVEKTRLPINKQLDLISHFLQTGSFPWWEHSTTLDRLEMVLESLLHFNPTSLKRLVLDVLHQPIVRKRIVATFKFSHLHQIIELLLERDQRPKEKSWLLLKDWSQQIGNVSDFHEQFWNELFQCVVSELQGMNFSPKALIHLVNQTGIQSATSFHPTTQSTRILRTRFNLIEAIADVFNLLDWKEELEIYEDQPTHSSEVQEQVSNLEEIIRQLRLNEDTPTHSSEVKAELESNLEEITHQLRLNEDIPTHSSEVQAELVFNLEEIIRELRLNEVTPTHSTEVQAEHLSNLEEILRQLRLNEDIPTHSSEVQAEQLSDLEDIIRQLHLNEGTPAHSSEVQAELVPNLEEIIRQLRLNKGTPTHLSEVQAEQLSNLEDIIRQLRLNDETPSNSTEVRAEHLTNLAAILRQLRLNEETSTHSSEAQAEYLTNLEEIIHQLRLNEDTPTYSSEVQAELESNLEDIIRQLRLNEDTPTHSSEVQAEQLSNLEDIIRQLRLNEGTPSNSTEVRAEQLSDLEDILHQLRLNEDTPTHSSEVQAEQLSDLEDIIRQLRLNEDPPTHSSEVQAEQLSDLEDILHQLRLNEDTPTHSSEVQAELESNLEEIIRQLRLNEDTPTHSSEVRAEQLTNLEDILHQLRLNEDIPTHSSEVKAEQVSRLEEIIHQLRLKETDSMSVERANENPNQVEQISKNIPSDERLSKLLEQFEAKYLSEIPQTESEKQRVENTNASAFSPKIDAFSQSDKLYVRNAGLVLLWPFLRPFFEKLALVIEGAFVDTHAAEKASWLLQHIVLGNEAALFEAHLPLNKVLVGMLPDEYVPAAQSLTEFEKFAIDELLEAVTNYMPAWKNLTADGFQRAYLQREGALSARDGNWLLQVKRETYDILLDKMPWSISIVKLPWMKHHLIVEW